MARAGEGRGAVIVDLAECDPRVAQDGSLSFRLPGVADSTCEIAPWHQGSEARRLRAGGSAPGFFWSLKLFPREPGWNLPNCCARLRPKVSAFLEQIPPEVRFALSRFEFGQAFLLPYLAQCAGARDLLESNPNLLWLVAVGAHDGAIRPDEIPALSHAKQVEILRLIVGQASKATLRLLRRIELEAGSLGEGRALKAILRQPPLVEATAHERGVPLYLLLALGRHPRLVNKHIVGLLGRFLQKDCRNPHAVARNLSGTLDDLDRMAWQLRCQRPDHVIRQCRSIEEINVLHDRWVERMNEVLYARFGNPMHAALRRPQHEPAVTEPVVFEREPEPPARFPVPPFEDCAHIKAIRTFKELAKEGRQQGNCVAAYAPAVVERRVYIYRVLAPERATLELVKTTSGWCIGQLLRAGNEQVRSATRAYVTDWLRSNA